jgi:branched-chain amino acid transport system permease protein/urea transport system permease protein
LERGGVVKFFSNSWFAKGEIARLLVLAFFIFFPLIGDDYLIAMLTQFIIYGIFAMGLSLVWGYTGILCFGHAVFFGLGAYIMALATKHMIPGISGILTTSLAAIVLAVIGVALLALVLGYFLFYGRLSGPYLGIVTLAIAVIAERIAVKWYYIGGYNGLINVPPLSFAGWEVLNFKVLFYVILAIGLAVYLVCDRVVRSPFGTILAAVRNNEVRAEFFGYNIAQFKIIIFAIGAAVAGLAGALFAAVTEFVSPTMLGFGLSTEVLIWVALGGKEVLLASFLGAVLVRVLEAFLSDILAYYWILILGMFFVFCVMFFPKGVFGNLLASRTTHLSSE